MIKKEEQDAVISEYETLLETMDKLRNNVKKDLKTYNLLTKYFISHLKENFKVLQLLLKNYCGEQKKKELLSQYQL